MTSRQVGRSGVVEGRAKQEWKKKFELKLILREILRLWWSLLLSEYLNYLRVHQ